MAYLILTKEQADSVRGRHGSYSELQPVLLPNGKYALPEECKNDPDLITVKNQLEVVSEIQPILQLPEAGSNLPCVKDTIYYYADPDLESANMSGMVICVQDHNRTIYKPQETPALFSFYRENTDDLEWIENEHVQLGWKRWYNGTQYEVIQAHQTLSTWTPPATINVLWKTVAPPSGGEWAVGVAYSVNDMVTYLGNSYKCLQAHTSQAGWTPAAVPALWQLQ